MYIKMGWDRRINRVEVEERKEASQLVLNRAKASQVMKC